MRSNRRRLRRSDPLAATAAVRYILEQLRARAPEIIPQDERKLLKMLEAVRHIERRPATDSARGRPPDFDRDQLLEVARHLKAVLARETSSRVSLSSFIGGYLRILHFPSDVQDALSKSEINLSEAAQLARLNEKNLNCKSAKAKSIRVEVLQKHLLVQGTITTLTERVRERIGEAPEVSADTLALAVQKVDDLLKVDERDKLHIFYEEMKRLFYAMREIEPEDIDDKSLEDFMQAADQLSNTIYAIELKRRRRVEPRKILKI